MGKYGKVWEVDKSHKEQDSGVSSNSSNCEDDDMKATVAARVEKSLVRPKANLEKEKEQLERVKRLEEEKIRLEEEAKNLKEKQSKVKAKKQREKIKRRALVLQRKQKLLKETIKTVKHEQKTGRPRTKPLGRPRKEPKVTLTAAELEEKVFHKDEEEKNIEEFLEEIESSL